MNNYCVYIHKNLINNRLYIGITNDIKRRWRSNGIEYKPKKENTRPFWNAIEKYGWNNFGHYIIETGLSFEEACEKEKNYIKTYRENGHNLYNVAEGGNGGKIYLKHPKGMKGKFQTQHQKISHRKWASKKENNCMTNGKVIWGVTHEHPKGMKGKTHSDEYKKILSKKMKENNPYATKCNIIYPDGTVLECKSQNEASRKLEVSIDTVRRIIKENTPYELKPNTRHSLEKLQKIVGVRIILIKENTEVSN